MDVRVRPVCSREERILCWEANCFLSYDFCTWVKGSDDTDCYYCCSKKVTCHSVVSSLTPGGQRHI